MGVSPSRRTPPPCCISGTRFPWTIVVPFRLLTNGFVWAIWLANSGASRDTTTISRNSTSAAIAMRLCQSRRPASSHGLTIAAATGLLQPQLVEQDVPLRVELIAVDAAGQEIDQLGVVQGDPGRLVGDRVVDLRPHVVGRCRVGH